MPSAPRGTLPAPGASPEPPAPRTPHVPARPGAAHRPDASAQQPRIAMTATATPHANSAATSARTRSSVIPLPTFGGWRCGRGPPANEHPGCTKTRTPGPGGGRGWPSSRIRPAGLPRLRRPGRTTEHHMPCPRVRPLSPPRLPWPQRRKPVRCLPDGAHALAQLGQAEPSLAGCSRGLLLGYQRLELLLCDPQRLLERDHRTLKRHLGWARRRRPSPTGQPQRRRWLSHGPRVPPCARESKWWTWAPQS